MTSTTFLVALSDSFAFIEIQGMFHGPQGMFPGPPEPFPGKSLDVSLVNFHSFSEPLLVFKALLILCAA